MSYYESTLLIPAGCPYLTAGPDGDPYWRCGQGWNHKGECTWWTPGGYLPRSLITPLAWLAAGRLPWPWRGRCPLCGAPIGESRAEFTLAIYCDAENAERDELRWTFRPCGCEGRELVEKNEAAPGSSE